MAFKKGREGDEKTLYRWNLDVRAKEQVSMLGEWGVYCMNSPHNSTLCLDLQTEKPRNGLGMQTTLEHPKSPGPG